MFGATLSDASGVVTNINTYDDYGIPGAGNVGRFQYTGQAWLGEVGLQYSRARIYSPTLGRFLQTDPIGYADGLNWYNYVGSDPVNRIDPSGLACRGVAKIERVKDAETGEIVEVPTVVVTAGCGGRGGGSFGHGYFGGFFSGGNSGARFAAADDGAAPQGADPVDVTVTARRTPQKTQPSITDKIKDKAKEILCSETTGQVADAVAGFVTGGATNGAIKFANARYAAAVGGKIGSIVGQRAILIAAGPQAAIAIGVAFLTAKGVQYARGQFCPAGK